MRIANIDGRLVLAIAREYIDVATASEGAFGSDAQDIYQQWNEFTTWARALDTDGLPRVDITDTSVWEAPAPRPRQVFAIGLNYRDHADESQMQLPPSPTVFTKFPTSIGGHNQPVMLPNESVDWEVELVVVIGKTADRVQAEAAWSHIAGFTIGQDLSDRRLQLTGPAPQFSLAKSHRGFAPLGPQVVTVDELNDPHNLEINCALESGEVLQKARTSELIFPIPQLVEHLSSVCPLLPGDLIFTGTPAGVGAARNPQRFLRPGDVLISRIEGLGVLRTPLVAA
ncbi:fumarylacetoacetate hydrolase family protein [Nocardia abscessus]|uniref:fumarylacetoacetate hydrolase family protein n=1 Tax=Nocardia abscessus TaxID=120957 RepID=UPI0024573DEF|nr:fumarylacetoacetate hydrolase family protein [Nocardia abscessus]